MLLCGETPFGGCGGDETLAELRDNILACRYEFEPQDIWANVSVAAKDFVRTLLVPDPKQRPSAEKAMKLPWIRDYHHQITQDATVSQSVVRSLVAFKDLSSTLR